MVSFGIKIVAVWLLFLLGGMGDVPEPDLPKVNGCAKWFVVIRHQGMHVCGGALITHVMAITGCHCVSAQYESFVIRRQIADFTIWIEPTKTTVNVDMILPHPMCELNATSFPKFGTALIKAARSISLDPKILMPAPLYTLMVVSEFMQFHKLLNMPDLKCVVMLKPRRALGISTNSKCHSEAGIESSLNVKLYEPDECLKYCLLAMNASCPKEMRDHDLYCLRVLSGGAKSYDPVPGTPLVCNNRVWGLMYHFNRDIDSIYFFYGVRSVFEIYNMGVAFSVGNDCGGNKIVITNMRSRRAGNAMNLYSSPALNLIVLVIVFRNTF